MGPTHLYVRFIHTIRQKVLSCAPVNVYNPFCARCETSVHCTEFFRSFNPAVHCVLLETPTALTVEINFVIIFQLRETRRHEDAKCQNCHMKNNASKKLLPQVLQRLQIGLIII